MYSSPIPKIKGDTELLIPCAKMEKIQNHPFIVIEVTKDNNLAGCTSHCYSMLKGINPNIDLNLRDDYPQWAAYHMDEKMLKNFLKDRQLLDFVPVENKKIQIPFAATQDIKTMKKIYDNQPLLVKRYLDIETNFNFTINAKDITKIPFPIGNSAPLNPFLSSSERKDVSKLHLELFNNEKNNKLKEVDFSVMHNKQQMDFLNNYINLYKELSSISENYIQNNNIDLSPEMKNEKYQQINDAYMQYEHALKNKEISNIYFMTKKEAAISYKRQQLENKPLNKNKNFEDLD